MPHSFRKWLSGKADKLADCTTQLPPAVPEYPVPIPPPPLDHRKSIPPEITDRTGNMYTLGGKLARAEMAARRAAEVSSRYAKDLTKIARDSVACAEARALALLAPYSRAPPPPCEEPTTPVRDARLRNRDVFTVDFVLARARKASRKAKELNAEAVKADAYTRSLARIAQEEVISARVNVCYLLN